MCWQSPTDLDSRRLRIHRGEVESSFLGCRPRSGGPCFVQVSSATESCAFGCDYTHTHVHVCKGTRRPEGGDWPGCRTASPAQLLTVLSEPHGLRCHTMHVAADVGKGCEEQRCASRGRAGTRAVRAILSAMFDGGHGTFRPTASDSSMNHKPRRPCVLTCSRARRSSLLVIT